MIHRRVALAIAAAGLLTGCGSEAPVTPAAPAVADAGKVDMCTILTDTEFTGLGIELGLTGCHWQGEHLTLDRTDCTQLIDGGPVSLWIAVAPAFSRDGPRIDSCTEALRIAQLIEPRLP